MNVPPELRLQIEETARRAARVAKFLDLPTKQKQLAQHDQRMSEPGFWDNQATAQKLVAEASRIKSLTNPILDFQRRLDDLQILAELVADAPGESAAAELAEVAASAAAMSAEVDALETASFLTGPHDKCNAILSLKAGAGGTEACDWVGMLFRLYSRWAEKHGYDVEVEDVQAGDGTGISTITFRVAGLNAYGYAKAERGVHRLVRISPFDSNARRHTTFCALDVVAEIEDGEPGLDVKEGDLKIDVYRASGAGGQHVNRTESAVRLTHLPTGIVVACQRERSQHRNRDIAMKILKSRIYERQQDEKRAELDRVYGEKGEIGWGNQIRSYVFQPYQLVKDLRTGAETSSVQAVMDGGVDFFISAWLRAGGPRQRSKDLKTEE
jgi:peptide chain release factor 2